MGVTLTSVTPCVPAASTAWTIRSVEIRSGGSSWPGAHSPTETVNRRMSYPAVCSADVRSATSAGGRVPYRYAHSTSRSAACRSVA